MQGWPWHTPGGSGHRVGSATAPNYKPPKQQNPARTSPSKGMFRLPQKKMNLQPLEKQQLLELRKDCR